MLNITDIKQDYQKNFKTLGQVTERLHSLDDILELLHNKTIRDTLPLSGPFTFYLKQLCIISLEEYLMGRSKKDIDDLGHKLYQQLTVPFGTGQQEVMWIIMTLVLKFFGEFLKDSDLHDIFAGVRTWPDYCSQVAYDLWRMRTVQK